MTAAVSAEIDWRDRQPSRLVDMIRRQAALNPDAPALTEAAISGMGGPSIDYRGLDRAVAAAAQTFAGLGVGPGDRVLIVNENSIAAVTAMFAAAALDAWPVPVNARLSAREIDEIARHCEPRRIVFTTAVSPEAVAHADRHGAESAVLEGAGEVRIGPPGAGNPEPVTGDPVRDVGVLIYTSGTTGRPKGVMLSHRAALFVASSPGAQRPTQPGDVIYCALPIAHIYGLTSTCLRGLYGGAEVLLAPRFDPAYLAGALADGRVTMLQGVPQMYVRLLDHLRANPRAPAAPNLVFATMGGAYVEPALKEAAEAALGTRIVVGYGMTEFASTVTRSLPQHVGRDTCAGPLLPGIEARVVDAQGHDVLAGGAGELWIRGPNAMLGYYRDPQATAAVMTPDGWYRTGDLCRLDGDGFVHFVERDREVIIRSGFNVYPVEVEEVLAAHPDVALAAVVGRSVQGNEEVVAFVEPVAGRAPTPEALAAWAAERLGPYKRPAEIRIVDALPAAPTGKILKARLRELAAQSGNRVGNRVENRVGSRVGNRFGRGIVTDADDPRIDRDLVGAEPTSGFRAAVGYVIGAWREGYCEMVLDIGPQHVNRSGVLHGGVVMTLLDAAAGYAGCYCRDPDRVRKCVTLSLNSHFVKAATGGTVRSIGRVKGGGRRIFFSTAELVDARGNVLALGDGSFRYFRGSEDPAGVPVDTTLTG